MLKASKKLYSQINYIRHSTLKQFIINIFLDLKEKTMFGTPA